MHPWDSISVDIHQHATALRLQTSAYPALGTGVALFLTVALVYTLCPLVWLVTPGPFLGFLNSLLHGMDFKPNPLPTSAPFSWTRFVEALLVIALWAFPAAAFFGWLRLRLGA